MSRLTRFCLLLFCIVFTVLCFHDVAGFVDASRRGLLLFSNSVLPVLFPFFFITSLAVQSGVRKPWQVFAFSLLGGYPTSARMISELYEQGKITKRQALHLSTTTSFPSPIFIIATVGVSLFASVQIGVIAFAAIIIGALLNGLFYRGRGENQQLITTESKNHSTDFANAFSTALFSAVQSILLVGGLIVIFFIIGSQLDSLLNMPIGLDVVVSSVLEMTAGVFKLSSVALNPMLQVILVTAILSFSGICVGMQGMLFFKKFGMTFRVYMLYKTTHTLLAVAVAGGIAIVFGL